MAPLPALLSPFSPQRPRHSPHSPQPKILRTLKRSNFNKLQSEWWARGDSDSRPTGYEPGALAWLSYGPAFAFRLLCCFRRNLNVYMLFVEVFRVLLGRRKSRFFCFFLKSLQLFFTFFLQPAPPLKIPFIAPDFSLLFQPFFSSHSLLPSEILYHREMMRPDGAITELNEFRAR